MKNFVLRKVVEEPKNEELLKIKKIKKIKKKQKKELVNFEENKRNCYRQLLGDLNEDIDNSEKILRRTIKDAYDDDENNALRMKRKKRKFNL